MRRFKKMYVLNGFINNYDEFGQKITSYVPLREIEVMVVIKSNKILGLDGTEYTLVENLGLTIDKDVEEGMRLTNIEDGTIYEVTFVDNVARLTQLKLIEVRL